MADHARLSASSAERFLNCSASVALAEYLAAHGILEDESEYAAEGTAAHALGERCLRENQDAFMYVGQVMYVDKSGKEWEATPEMAEAVQEYVDYVRDMVGDAELLIETRIEDPELGPDFGGTADAVGYRIKDGGGFVHVLDYKHGAGIAVDIATIADNEEVIEFNKQLGYYAYGVLRKLGVKRGDNIHVGLSIVQPRAFHSEGSIRTVWVLSDAIIAWAEDELLPGMARVDTVDVEFKAGEWCRFCPAKIGCPLLQEGFNEMAEADPSSEVLEGLDNDALAIQFERISVVKMYIKAVEAECKRRAMASNPVAGTKLVYGRSTRVWKPEAEAELIERYGDEAYTEPALKSPAEIEKLPEGKTYTGRHSFKQKGNINLVAADASGEPYNPADQGAGFAAIPQPQESE